MDQPRIISGNTLQPDFWDTDDLIVLQNPRAPQPLPSQLPNIGILFATSGSSGQPKWIRHTRASLLASAAAVNHRFHATEQDVWLRALPLFHVGGMGIAARGYLSGARVISDDEPWNPLRMISLLETASVTHCSLVPTQVFDLVSHALRPPASLRAVIVGGGHLPSDLKSQALALGWPLLESYGLTEAASQVATEQDGNLTLLDCWEAHVNSAGCLEIKGSPLALEIWEQDRWQPITQNGWFTTTDFVELDGRNLTWLGRADSVVKILGELVNLDTVQQTLTRLAGREIVVLAMPDARQGHRLYANVTEPVKATYDETCPPFARLSGAFPAELIVRSALGKPQRQATQQAINAWLDANSKESESSHHRSA